MTKLWKKGNVAMLAPIPALLIGAIIMCNNGISPLIYGQNIICYLVWGLLLFFYRAKPMCTMCSARVSIAMLIIGCLAMACTFLDRGLENVHRWVMIGGFRLYISSILLPCMIIGLGKHLQRGSTIFPAIIITLILLMLALQPDASQLSAFGISATFLVWMQAKQGLFKYGMGLLSAGVIIYSWIHIDALAAVPHVEDILLLARDMGVAWFCLGIGSLALLLIPFLGFPKISMPARAVGLYYLVALASTFFGNFPVMIMGFGISPIIGYLLAVFLLLPGKTAGNTA